MGGDDIGNKPTALKGKVRVEEIFVRLRAGNPSPTTELVYGNVYQLLVAVVLSAQATDKGVNKATEPLFKLVETPQQMLELGEEQLMGFIKTIGLYRGKGKNVMALSRILVEQYGGEVPRTREELEALPGVGRKTANVMLNTFWGEATMAVDTHVFRVARRLKLSAGANVLAVEQDLLRVIPEEFLLNGHHWLILHGRYTCVARNPKCEQCVVAELCPSRQI